MTDVRKLNLNVGDLVEIDGRRYVVVPDRQGGITFEPSNTSVAAERRSTAIERTSGMFARLAPGVSLADELIADRRAEVRAEEQADEAERRRRGRS